MYGTCPGVTTPHVKRGGVRIVYYQMQQYAYTTRSSSDVDDQTRALMFLRTEPGSPL